MPDGTKPRLPIDSDDLDSIAAWLAEAPSCLREAWEERRPQTIAPPTLNEIMAHHWVVIDYMREFYEEQAELRRAEEKAERLSILAEQSAWRQSR